MHDAVVYTCPKNPEQFQAFARGFNARTMPASAWAWDASASLHIIGGLQYGSLQILHRARRESVPYVFFDRAYFGARPRIGALRATLGGYQQHWVNTDRLPPAYVRMWGVNLAPWREIGTHVLVVPPSAAVEQLYDINWERDWMPAIRAATQRPIVVSTKADRDKSPLAERLRDCHCVIAWTSNVAVEAIAAGIPAYVCGESAAAPVAGNLADVARGIEQPPMPDRAAWAASLGWGQFTLNEIASGFARDVVMEGACIPA